MEEMFELDMDMEPVAQYGKSLKTGVKDGLDLSYKERDDVLYPLPSDKTRSEQVDVKLGNSSENIGPIGGDDDNSCSNSSFYGSEEDGFEKDSNNITYESTTQNNFRPRAETTPTSCDPIAIGARRKTSRAEHIKPVIGENNQIDIFASMKSESLSLYASDHPIAIFGERPTDSNDSFSKHTLTSGARKVFTSTSYCPSSFIHR
uniref:Miff domain-containing protein n=1 Tax=Strongyloides papillosus TaxID=174720 RepID=A0A0N5BA54_STREA